MSNSFHQSAPQLVLGWERSRVCDTAVCSLILTDDIHVRYLYYQMFGVDACFQFKRRQISNYEKDPELGPGYVYLVAWEPYREYLCRFTDQEEVHCIYSLGSCLQLTCLANR